MVEVSKQANENGRYALSVYAVGAALNNHPSSQIGNKTKYAFPLKFTNIKLEKLDSEFFHKLLAFKAWPAWTRILGTALKMFMSG